MKTVIAILFIASIIATGTAVPPKARHTDNFQTYWDFDKIEDYLEDLPEEFNFTSRLDLGQTSEGRWVRALRVSLPAPKANTRKPIIIVESGLRPRTEFPREWIAPMVNLYFIHMLVEHFPLYQEVLEIVDFIFIPIANPDGYAYTRSTNRNWNKNRRFIKNNCIGVDLNRNFNYKFGVSNLCNEHYTGVSASSEPETMAIETLVEKYRSRTKMYLSLQAYGQQILTPYNYANVVGSNQQELLSLAKKMAKEIESINGRKYSYGLGAKLSQPENGTSSDYAYGKMKIPLTFTVKLPAGPQKPYEVPESDLSSILTESFYGFLSGAKYVARMNFNSNCQA